MNIVQIETTKISTEGCTYSVHCVHIPSILNHANFGQFKAKQVLYGKFRERGGGRYYKSQNIKSISS